MNKNIVYKKKDGISARPLGNETMLYDSENDKVHILNETGTLIWNLLDGKNSIQIIQDSFSKQFPDTNSEEIFTDIKEITEKLSNEGLISLI
jgi:hypothetical protein